MWVPQRGEAKGRGCRGGGQGALTPGRGVGTLPGMVNGNLVMMVVAAVVVADWRWRLGVVRAVLGLTWRAAVRLGKWVAWRCRPAPVTFGAARWLAAREAAALGLLGETGLIVGKMGRRLLRFADVEGSVVVFAPQGAGKGVGVVIPNLLSYPGSVICTDPKGENYAITARRRRAFGPVYCINVGDPARSHRFNPMDALSRDDLKAVDDCRRLAELLMPLDARDGDDHWRKRSVSILTGFILYVLDRFGEDPVRCNLATVDKLLSEPKEVLQERLEAMQLSPQLVVRSVASRLLSSLDTEEGLNLLSNIAKGTEIWGSGFPLGRLARGSDFDLERDIVGRVGSLYVSVPEDMKAVYAPFMRVMVGLSLHAVARVGRHGVGADRPLFMLDEAAALGTIPELEDGMAHLRAYARAVLVFQDLGQVRATYRKWESLISNASCQVFLGINDETTAEKVSRMLGERTVEVRTAGVNTGADTVLAHHENAGVGEAGRRLLQPSEVLRLGRDQVIAFVRGVPQPILGVRVRYYAEAMFAGMFDAWRDGSTAVVPLMLEHVPLRLGLAPLRLEHVPVAKRNP